MLCAKCGKESGNLYCGKCRAEIRKSHTLIPVLFYDKERKGFRAGCSVVDCPCNENGVCSSTLSLDTVKFVMHEYDGDNCVKLPCG